MHIFTHHPMPFSGLAQDMHGTQKLHSIGSLDRRGSNESECGKMGAEKPASGWKQTVHRASDNAFHLCAGFVGFHLGTIPVRKKFKSAFSWCLGFNRGLCESKCERCGSVMWFNASRQRENGVQRLTRQSPFASSTLDSI
jgi:hypothetical protein